LGGGQVDVPEPAAVRDHVDLGDHAAGEGKAERPDQPSGQADG
jgi:hypothetical protein